MQILFKNILVFDKKFFVVKMWLRLVFEVFISDF
jgi:hypothetical protein